MSKTMIPQNYTPALNLYDMLQDMVDLAEKNDLQLVVSG